MQTGFDPYREWLGIPDAGETPNHYRLLNLRLFEDDARAIAKAAAQASQIVGRQLSGSHAASAKMLLKQIELARTCLTSSSAKQHYDQLLRSELMSDPIVVSPKAKFVPQAGAGPLLPPSPSSPRAEESRGQSQGEPPASPAMRVTVQQATPSLTPPGVLPADLPAPLPPSAFAATGSPPPGSANIANDDFLPPQANVPPVAMPVYAQPPYAQPTPAQPFTAQPPQAQPYPQHAAPMAIPVPPPGMTAIPQAAPVAQPVTTYAATGVPMASAPVAHPVGDAPAISTATSRAWRRRPSAPTALYFGLPIAATIVLLLVVLNNNRQPGQPTGSGGTPPNNQGQVARLPDAASAPQNHRANRSSNRRRSSDAESSGRSERRWPPNQSEQESATPAAAMPVPLAANDAPAMPATTPDTPAPADDAEAAQQISQALTEARQALSKRDLATAAARIDAARQYGGNQTSQQEIARVDAIAEYVKGFWNAVEEQIKGLAVGDQTMLRDAMVGVVDVNPEQLVLRVNGENRTYARDDLPIGVAIGLAEAWLNKDDPASNIFLGVIHVVHPKGDRAKARQLWQQAAAGGKSQEVALVMPELDVTWPGQSSGADAVVAATRMPPMPSDLAAAQQEVSAMFEAELSAAAEAADRAALAEKMFQRASEASDAAPLQFALLSEAARLAAQGGDFEQMLAALDLQAERFGTDAVESKSDILFESAKSTNGSEPNQKLATAALATSDEAVLLEQFDQAARLARIALGAARKAGNSELLKEAALADKEVRDLKKD